VVLEFGTALAGVTLVTANPAYLPKELVYVLRQSHATGIVVCPEYRDLDFVAILNEIRAEIPAVREMTSLADWAASILLCAVSAGLSVQKLGLARYVYEASSLTLPLYFSLKGKHGYVLTNASELAAR
jgi:acyl-CoA synthetase (AMP-forming)/AMP-acid ligase II